MIFQSCEKESPFHEWDYSCDFTEVFDYIDSASSRQVYYYLDGEIKQGTLYRENPSIDLPVQRLPYGMMGNYGAVFTIPIDSGRAVTYLSWIYTTNNSITSKVYYSYIGESIDIEEFWEYENYAEKAQFLKPPNQDVYTRLDFELEIIHLQQIFDKREYRSIP